MTTEYSYAVAPRSKKAIIDCAENFLANVAPEHLVRPAALDMITLVDFALAKEGIHVYPVCGPELPNAEAETRAAASTDDVEIWVRSEFYKSLFERDSNTVRARSTLAHEIGHAVLHRDELSAGRHSPEVLAMRRAPRRQLKAYEDSEWQAHMFASALLIPVRVLKKMRTRDARALAATFKVSERFVTSHLKRVASLTQ